MLKALSVREIFIFLSRLFAYVEKRLDKRAKVNFEIFEVTDWKQIVTIHTLPNISRNKTQLVNEIWPANRISCEKCFS